MHTQTHRHGHRYTHTHRHRHRDTHSDTETQTHAHTDTHRYTDTDTETHTHMHTHRHTDTDTERETHTHRHTDIQCLSFWDWLISLSVMSLRPVHTVAEVRISFLLIYFFKTRTHFSWFCSIIDTVIYSSLPVGETGEHLPLTVFIMASAGQ